MVKKKVSGQTIAIIILSILLLLAISFGGVYAYYTNATKTIYGEIRMAYLHINLITDTDNSDFSQILQSNGLFVPGQRLKNSPLIIENKSNTETYLVVVYKVNTDKEVVDYDDSKPLIDIGLTNESLWSDYLFVSYDGGVRTRCLVTKTAVPAVPTDADPDQIIVIGKDELKIPSTWGNGYMNMNIGFSFQAFAIGKDTFDFEETETGDSKFNKIVNAIYTDNSHLHIWD